MRMHKRGRNSLLLVLAVVLVLLLGSLVLYAVYLSVPQFPPPTEPTVPSTTAPSTEPATQPTTEPTTVPTEPPVVKEATVTLGAVGDVLMHKPVINTGLQSDGSYDFSYCFEYFADYCDGVDYIVGNLETTLSGLDNGYPYQGYPRFNSPDGIITSLQNVGFDMVLTANNHSYDTRNAGFMRTQQVIDDLSIWLQAHPEAQP